MTLSSAVEAFAAAATVPYRLVGTAAALLQGVDLPVADVDVLLTDRAGVDAFAANNPADLSETAEVGLLARAHWFGHDGAWFVTVTGAGTSVHPSEHLDFAPTVTEREVAAFHAYLSNTDPTA
jgi:hypothetical protein